MSLAFLRPSPLPSGPFTRHFLRTFSVTPFSRSDRVKRMFDQRHVSFDCMLTDGDSQLSQTPHTSEQTGTSSNPRTGKSTPPTAPHQGNPKQHRAASALLSAPRNTRLVPPPLRKRRPALHPRQRIRSPRASPISCRCLTLRQTSSLCPTTSSEPRATSSPSTA